MRQGYRHPTCHTFEEGVRNQLIGKIDYLTIPVTANLNLLKSRNLITTLGFLGGYNTKAVQYYPEPTGGCHVYYIPDLTSTTPELTLSGIVGIGYRVFENHKIELIPVVEYSQGLTNTFKSPFPGHSLNIEKKYSAVLMTIKLNYKL